MSDTEITLAVVGEKVDHLNIRIGKLEKKVSAQGGKVTKMSNKIFNGFDSKIDALDAKVDANKKDNDQHHARLEKTLGRIIKFGATSVVLIFIALMTILGSIWATDRRATQQIEGTHTHVEVEADAFDGTTSKATP